jgi:hypothetical protein
VTAARTAVVSGMVAGDPRQGGATWAVLQWVLGLERLGYEVALLEPVNGGHEIPLSETASARYFDAHVTPLVAGPAALLRTSTGEAHGLSRADVAGIGERASVLINVSGMLPLEPPFDNIPVRAYLDLDPAFNQLWNEQCNVDVHFSGHTHHVTVGTRVGSPDCGVPSCGLEWLSTLPPVVLERWPFAAALTTDALTTVSNWRSYGSIEVDGVLYGQKAHSFRSLLPLAEISSKPLQPALAIHEGEIVDLDALRAHGWHWMDPAQLAADPAAYQSFVQGSWGELGVAKSGYVESRCGWVSDRSACYLASGRPVVAQDTGFGDALPTGDGLLTFHDVDSAAEAIDDLRARYGTHRAAARVIAEQYLDSDRVLSGLLDRIGAL